MPGTSKEKEKCLEKLTQMEKYLPFLDFMIDKIKKKNKETSWECPLNKFQNLRSMITEKSKRHNWDAIVKVENVIQKLIVKIDYKEEQFKESAKHLTNPKPDSVEGTKSTDSSVPTLPSCTTTVITNTSNLSHITRADSRPRDSPTNTVDFIMNKLKVSIDSNEKNNKCQKIEKESLEKMVGPKESWDNPFETDLDKDLDGFDLTDTPLLSSGISGKNSEKKSAPEVPKMVSSHQDLLSTSRKKLMMSLGKVLGSSFLDRSPSQTCAGNKSAPEQTSDSQSVSAFNSCGSKTPPVNSAPEKTKSDTCGLAVSSDKDRHYSNASATSNEKPVSVPLSSPKSPSEYCGKLNKSHTHDFPSQWPGGMYDKQQTIRERLSADISEILRVPGKSVGGSLRSLKYAINPKESKYPEETESVRVTEETGTTTSVPSTCKSHKKLLKSKTDGKREERSKEKKGLENTCQKDKPKNEISVEKDKGYKASNKNWNPSPSGKEPDLDGHPPRENPSELKMLKENGPRNTTYKPTVTEKSTWKSPPPVAELGKPNMVHSASDFTKCGKVLADCNIVKPTTEDVNKHCVINDPSWTEPSASDAAKNSASSYIPVIVSSQRKKSYKGVKNNIQLGDDSYDVDDSEYAQRLIEETTPNPAVIKIKTVPDRVIECKSETPRVETSLENKEPITIPLTKETKFGEYSKQESRTHRNNNKKKDTVLNASHPSATQKLLIPHSETPKQDPTQYLNAVPSIGLNVRGGNDLNSSDAPQNLKNKMHRGKERPPIHTPALDKLPGNTSAPQNHPNVTPMHRIPGAPGIPLVGPVPTVNAISQLSKVPKSKSHNLPEAKSYAEYKRMKQITQERLKRSWESQRSKKGLQPPSFINSQASQGKSVPSTNANGQKNIQVPHGPYSPQNTKKFSQRRNSNFINVNQYHNYRKRTHPNHSLKPMVPTQKQIDRVQKSCPNEPKSNKNIVESKKETQDTRKKNTNEKRISLDSEESISPLECLYEEESTVKTGRGYGIKKFKIPKKVPQNSDILIQQENVTLREEVKRKIENLSNKSVPNNEHDNKEAEKGTGADGQTTKSASKSATDQPEGRSPNHNKKDHFEKTPPETIPGSPDSNDGKVKNGVSRLPNAEPMHQTEAERAEKEDAEKKEMALDSESNQKSILTAENTNNKGSKENSSEVHPSSDLRSKGTLHVPKEEITQDLVEALIRKSFQSGEGKLLLAQAKLFEKLALKLNSEKLKTIQKIINSETDSTSSSIHDSEDEKKKKAKKLVKGTRSRKRKRKYRKIRKLESSSEEDDEIRQRKPADEVQNDKLTQGTHVKNNEEELNQQGETADMGEKESPIMGLITPTEIPFTKTDQGDHVKSKQESPEANLRKCMSNKKNLRKQGQKKLLEQILNEKSEPETRSDSRNSDGKEPEQKARGRQKGKTKTELDRLHDDIRNMFICSGVVTATGIRMCRMLKESGGRMNDLDLVKESAKMVKEQKLQVLEGKSKRTRARVVKTPYEESETTLLTSSPEVGHSSTLSSDKAENAHEKITAPVKTETNSGAMDSSVQEMETLRPGPIVSASNFTKQPCVLLRKLDLSTWNYGVKVSEGDMIYCMGGKALVPVRQSIKKQSKSQALVPEKHRPKHNVFLPRNIRKVRRQLTINPLRKTKKRKTLQDILNQLPMKNQAEEALSKTLMENNNIQTRNNAFSLDKMLSYAFDQNKSKYGCLLCPTTTKNIVLHYKNFHQRSEVLISRLNPDEAKSAIADARKNNHMALLGHRRSPLKLERLNSHKKATLYCCRFCGWSQTTNINLFFIHVVSLHTGECKHRCPSNKCSYSTNSRNSIKTHVQKTHGLCNYHNFRDASPWCPLLGRSKRLYGYMCSTCHYVQISLANLKIHRKIQHSSLKNVRIFKINMSRMPSKDLTNTSSQNNASKTENKQARKEPGKKSSLQRKTKTTATKKEDERRGKQKADDNTCLTASKKPRVHENEALREPEYQNPLPLAASHPINNSSVTQEAMHMNPSNQHEVDGMPESILLENCFDVESVTKTADKAKGSGPGLTRSYAQTIGRPIKKLKVGPLEAQILDNAVVLYECFVKGCLFSTKVFDLFEKHVKISHAKTKWNGICKVCYDRNGSQVHLTSYKLIYALNHLKHHERDNEAVTIRSLSALNKPVSDVLSPVAIVKKEVEDNSNEKASGVSDASYPRVPLLRVRNLIGDRLSTPKDIGGGFVTNSDYTVSIEKNRRRRGKADAALCLNEEAPAMFTIENVRSLKPGERAEGSDDQVIHNSFEQETAKAKGKEAVQNKTVWNSCGIPVRSCPTRPIAIRPDCSNLQVDGSQLRVVQTAPVTSVILNPLPAPIRAITPLPSSQAASKFSVQPVMVSVNPPFLATSKTVSVMVPVSSPKMTSATSTSALLSLEDSSSSPQVVVSDELKLQPIEFPSSASSSLPEVTISFSDSPKKSEKSKRFRTKVYRSNQDGAASSSEADETDEGRTKAPNSPQKSSTSSTGSKSVKDTKIYEEMLNKTKLCHLFKCMAVECSFTCNKESIFTQHIGLHEAQRRMNKKTTKNTGVDAKLRKSTNWYQCAYCCEVLASTSFALSQHIIVEHGHCIYQCAYCFYRAVSQSYVEIHQDLVHAHLLETKPRVIYKCKPLSRGPSETTALEKHTRRQSVRPYHCDQCGAKFFITQEFMTHLTTEHQSVTAYTCHICKNLFFKAERLINHYKLHSYCTFQCAYCLHGTEIQKEMVYHLCNFHFSQPAYMYVRALAENQKVCGNQLDSLKVVVYEYDKLSPDCIVEAEANEDIQDDPPKNEESSDISAIAAELGISIEPSLSGDAEEASGDRENEKSEGSILLSQKTRRESTEDRDVSSVPLGQLSLEVVSAGGRKEIEGQADAENVSHPDKNFKLNEILIQLQNKDKPLAPGSSPAAVENAASGLKEKIASAFHKLPPVVLSRITGPKNVYPPKTLAKGMSSKRTEGSPEDTIGPGDRIGREASDQISSNESPVPPKSAGSSEPDKTDKNKQTKVVENQIRALFTKGVTLEEKNESFQASHNLTDPSSKLLPRKRTAKSDKTAKPPDADSSTLKPPIIRVEDFSLDDGLPKLSVKQATEIKTEEILPESNKEAPSGSPDIVIIEEDKTDNVLTVTIDSEDEKEPERNENHPCPGVNDACADGRTIRKEMEKLRNQIANETDCLLFDDLDGNVPAPNLDSAEKTSENPPKKTFLSPIEEAISSLNKKLEEEGEKRKKDKPREQEEGKKPEEVRTIPRTRSSTRRGEEGLEKSDSDDSNMAGSLPFTESTKKDQKTFKVGLSGKDLFICGNDKCDFSADGDLQLKDHLYVCDLSRETTSLMCPHCFKFIKQFNTYIEHLKHHGEQKYACGLCSFKSAVEMSVTRHVKQKHKCDQLKSMPMDPPKEGYMVYYPKGFKLEKQDFESSGYSPGDEDKLPLQAVYQVNVKCAKCPYFTKVRSNMVRHLKIHVKSAETEGVVIVPSTAPTNPVPCLDTKEKMFDKMTNLAASSQLAQAKEKTAIEALAPEDEAKLPQFVAEQMRYKCCLADCNYITVDEGMLKHHIKALHDEITYYSCPHCSNEVPVEVRHVTLDKIGYHLKLHDGKLYKCPHCTYFHYQKAVVEKHTLEKHPERRYYVHTVREPRSDPVPIEEPPAPDVSKAWKCGLCDDCQSFSKVSVMDHVAKVHGTKSKYKCRLCDMKSNLYHSFFAHFASKHAGEKVAYMKTMVQVTSNKSESSPSKADFSGEHFDTTPLWQRGAPRVRHIRGILIEEEEVRTKKNKKPSEEAEVGPEESETVAQGTGFHCPICKKKFCARNADFFRSHLYQELNYQQFACTLCGKMFVDKKDYEKHHAKTHPEKAQALKQTKEDGEIMFWVDKVIAKQKEEIDNKKRQLSENSSSDSEGPQKKRRRSDGAQELRLPV